MDTNNPRCYTCKHWLGNRASRDLERIQGECHRNPPQIAGLIQQQTISGPQPSAVTAFPTINALAFCGEWATQLQVIQ